MGLPVAFISVVPSPYQRDLFCALSRRPEVELHVFYLEAASPDSPWPQESLAPYETILPGSWAPLGAARVHFNRPPDLRGASLVVMNTLMSVTGQWLMRMPLRRKPWVFWGERLNEQSGRKVGHRALAAPLHQAAAIAAVGTWAQRAYQREFPEPRHFSVPYYCDLRAFTEARGSAREAKEFTFLFCGQMIARKGIDVLLEAFAAVAREHADARLLLVGREAELPSMLKAFPAEIVSRVTYAGFQPPKALPAFFAQADVFVMPSRYDGWGVVVNQAIGAGLPILCSDRAGAGYDLVEPEVNGLRFPANDVNALATAMRTTITHRDRTAAWGAASQQRAAEWTPERGADKWVEIIRTVLTR